MAFLFSSSVEQGIPRAEYDRTVEFQESLQMDNENVGMHAQKGKTVHHDITISSFPHPLCPFLIQASAQKPYLFVVIQISKGSWYPLTPGPCLSALVYTFLSNTKNHENKRQVLTQSVMEKKQLKMQLKII